MHWRTGRFTWTGGRQCIGVSRSAASTTPDADTVVFVSVIQRTSKGRHLEMSLRSFNRRVKLFNQMLAAGVKQIRGGWDCHCATRCVNERCNMILNRRWKCLHNRREYVRTRYITDAEKRNLRQPRRHNRIGCHVTTATLGGTLTVPVSRRSQSTLFVRIAQRINVQLYCNDDCVNHK